VGVNQSQSNNHEQDSSLAPQESPNSSLPPSPSPLDQQVALTQTDSSLPQAAPTLQDSSLMESSVPGRVEVAPAAQEDSSLNLTRENELMKTVDSSLPGEESMQS